MPEMVLSLTSLPRLKAILGKANTTNDDLLEQVIMEATNRADSFTRRKLRVRTYGSGGLPAEVRDGNGETWIDTHQWPVVSITSIHDDTNRDFAAATLKASSEYFIDYKGSLIHLEPDAPKGTHFTVGRQNVQLIYTGGYGTFEILDGINDKLDFEETSASELTATVAEGVYTASGLATVIDTALEAVGASEYTTTYSHFTGKFTIASDRAGGGNTFKVLWSSGTNIATGIGRTIGFDVSADDNDAASHTADNSIMGIPWDLEHAVLLICQRILRLEKGLGGAGFDLEKEMRPGTTGGTTEFDTSPIPKGAMDILKRYRRVHV